MNMKWDIWSAAFTPYIIGLHLLRPTDIQTTDVQVMNMNILDIMDTK